MAGVLFNLSVHCKTVFSLPDEKDVCLVEKHCHICPWKVMEPSVYGLIDAVFLLWLCAVGQCFSFWTKQMGT